MIFVTLDDQILELYDKDRFQIKLLNHEINADVITSANPDEFVISSNLLNEREMNVFGYLVYAISSSMVMSLEQFFPKINYQINYQPTFNLKLCDIPMIPVYVDRRGKSLWIYNIKLIRSILNFLKAGSVFISGRLADKSLWRTLDEFQECIIKQYSNELMSPHVSDEPFIVYVHINFQGFMIHEDGISNCE